MNPRQTRLAALALGLSLLAAAPPPDEEKSRLEREPDGWTDLLAGAGHGLKGWTRVPIPPDGKLRDESPWSIDDRTGRLICEGQGVHEWLRWDEEQGDAVFHVEWRFTPVEGKKGYNSGVFVRNSADGKVWHQAQTNSGSGGFLFGDTPANGKLQRINLAKSMTEKRERPAGEWNTFEVTCRGRDVTLWVNGGVTCSWDGCAVPKGYVGVEAEGWRIEFRNVKVKPLQ